MAKMKVLGHFNWLARALASLQVPTELPIAEFRASVGCLIPTPLLSYRTCGVKGKRVTTKHFNINARVSVIPLPPMNCVVSKGTCPEEHVITGKKIRGNLKLEAGLW